MKNSFTEKDRDEFIALLKFIESDMIVKGEVGLGKAARLTHLFNIAVNTIKPKIEEHILEVKRVIEEQEVKEENVLPEGENE